MQSMSSDNASQRDMAPKPRTGKSGVQPERYEEQEDQWAVLRHEVEVEDMMRQDERERASWEQRDTGDDEISPQANYAAVA